MVKVEIVGDKLVVQPLGWARLWTLRRRLEIPLKHVMSVRADPAVGADLRDNHWLSKKIGTNVPRYYVAGTFSYHGRVFCDVRHPRNTVVVELQNEKFNRLIVEVNDPDAAVGELARALAG